MSCLYAKKFCQDGAEARESESYINDDVDTAIQAEVDGRLRTGRKRSSPHKLNQVL